MKYVLKHVSNFGFIVCFLAVISMALVATLANAQEPPENPEQYLTESTADAFDGASADSMNQALHSPDSVSVEGTMITDIDGKPLQVVVQTEDGGLAWIKWSTFKEHLTGIVYQVKRYTLGVPEDHTNPYESGNAQPVLEDPEILTDEVSGGTSEEIKL